MGRFEIKLQYADRFSRGKWNSQECIIYAQSVYDAEQRCKKLYGLGEDCDYRIISIKEI